MFLRRVSNNNRKKTLMNLNSAKLSCKNFCFYNEIRILNNEHFVTPFSILSALNLERFAKVKMHRNDISENWKI